MIDQDFTDSILVKFFFNLVGHQDCLTLSCEDQNWVDFAKYLRFEETFDCLLI